MTASSALCGLLLCEDARGGMSLRPRLCWAQGLIIISLLYKSSLKTPWGKSKKCNQCKARDLIREGANSKSPKFLLLHTTTTITTSYFTKSKIHFDYQRIIFQGKKVKNLRVRFATVPGIPNVESAKVLDSVLSASGIGIVQEMRFVFNDHLDHEWEDDFDDDN